jgi:hypothetical protein
MTLDKIKESNTVAINWVLVHQSHPPRRRLRLALLPRPDTQVIQSLPRGNGLAWHKMQYTIRAAHGLHLICLHLYIDTISTIKQGVVAIDISCEG